MELLPGDVGLSTIGGWTGTWIAAGQAIIGDGCRYTHARIVIGVEGSRVMYLEAMPGGARVVSTAFPSEAGVWWRLPLDDAQRAGIAEIGRDLVGTPYSFADYLALAMWERKIPGRLLVRNYVKSSGHMICSQLVDHVLCGAGYHLFDDGRLPQDVTPGDLFYALTDQGERVL